MSSRGALPPWPWLVFALLVGAGLALMFLGPFGWSLGARIVRVCISTLNSSTVLACYIIAGVVTVLLALKPATRPSTA